ncbi:hypothetical protein QKU48_gp0410 [Fadolivirus algeromassiliense]|jgi:hypothetical protein|uniref:Uncharacterized protein n=1 Tax=Fadolivirus FV1/VV64 TaxID=3070911 RepID=A0A7D3UPE6_9VIRU|nr:hypothetical protein QKU48_gp0410 [Fadolivirus algeromassiliense]QKF93868.1 hypothetical protein Fadolivirus_1_410 [Fadolivirus FV1/VV64]
MDRDKPVQPFQQFQNQGSFQQQKQSQFGPKPIVDLQVYPPPKPKPQSLKDKESIHPAMYLPMPAQSPYIPPQFNPYWPNYYNPYLVNPVIKQYNINSAPFLDQSTLQTGILKEDSLPRHFSNTSNTLGERLNIYNFVRSVFIKHYDGEDIDLDGRGTNSLLRYLKFLELNPYNVHQNENNPYRGLPSDMLIYKTCYPIRYDERSGSVQCAPNSLGMNIRIYRLTFAEYNIKKLEGNKSYNDFNVWREISYYEFIRENIIKRKICPNFNLLYGYYVNEKCNVNFDKVAMLTGKQIVTPQEMLLNQQQMKATPQPQKTYNGIPYQKVSATKEMENININSFSGRGLVALTEAPTYNLYRWASKEYQSLGNIHKMMNTGYHKSEVWMSILFQLMVALYVMQLHKIAFTNFSLEDNVYIKDISQHENVIMYWKYKLNNFEYYVPNYGYLLMIDSNYKDIDGNHATLLKNIMRDSKFKIIGNIYGNQDSEVEKACIDSFIKAFDPNIFTNAFTNYGGVKPPADIIKLITEIHNEAVSQQTNLDIGKYIYKYMYKFLNNRIGTYLSELESKNVRLDGPKDFIKGQMLVQEVGAKIYKFVAFVEQVQNNMAVILTKDNPKDEIIKPSNPIGMGALFAYTSTEPILQNYKPTELNLNEEELLETYIVGK